MKNTALALILVLVLCVAAVGQTKISFKREAWDLGNNLSQAALINSMTKETDLAKTLFSSAEVNAKNLGISLPGLPPKTHDEVNDMAVALDYLINSTGKPILEILTEDFGAEYAAAFEISYKMNTLMMLYEPGGRETTAIVGLIKKRSQVAGLPVSTFEKLEQLIADEAAGSDVRAEIFLIQKLVSDLVALNEFIENGRIYFDKGEYANSVAEFNESLKILPDNPEVFFLRARSLMQLDKYKEAISDYTNAIKNVQTAQERANLPVIYHNRGLCYGLLKKYTQALADLDMAVKLDPEYASAYKIRSLVNREMGRTKAADADYRKAESLQPGIMKGSR